VVVHCELGRTGHRRVVEIACPTGEINGSTVVATTVFALAAGSLLATGELPVRVTKFEANGFDPAVVIGS
jgi:hypothetical protein